MNTEESTMDRVLHWVTMPLYWYTRIFFGLMAVVAVGTILVYLLPMALVILAPWALMEMAKWW